MQKNSILKIILVTFIGIIVLWLMKEILFPSNYFNLNLTGSYGGGHMNNINMNGSYGFGAGTFSLILVFFIKVLFVIFVIALLIGLFLTIKNYIFTPQDYDAFKNSFRRPEFSKKTCDICGKTLEDGWKVCPYCSAEVKEN